MQTVRNKRMARAALLTLLTPLFLVAAVAAHATRIDLTPSLTTVGTGSTFSVSVVLSGLSAPTLALTDFDLDISYNPALLHASSVGFGSGLGIPPDIFGSNLSTAGIVDLFAVSFANFATLRASQGDAFTLATLTFLALAPGVDSLAFVHNASFIVDLIGGANQNPVNAADATACQRLNCVDVGAARVVITQPVTTVAEPPPWLLFGIASLACMLATRRGGVRR